MERPAAAAVKVTDWAEVTAETVALNTELLALAGTVTDAGTETAVLLLDRLTVSPVLPAGAVSVMVQASVPAPVKVPVAQEIALSVPGAAIPEAVMLTTAEGLVEELLVMVSVPLNELTWGEVNVISSVTACPGFRVTGAVTPDAANSEPATEIAEMVTGPVPVELKTTGRLDVCPAITLPKARLLVLTLSVPTAATPEAVMLTTAVGLVDELLVMVSAPQNELTWGDENVIVNVAVWPGFRVKGAATPDSVNSEPATEMAEIVTGAVPVEVKTTGSLDVCPTITLPKARLFVLTLSVSTAATPEALMLTTAEGLVDELLVMVSVPVNELTWGDVNVIVNVAVWPAFSVKGAATPDSVNSEPATEMAEIVTGAVPVEVKVTVLEADIPTATLPKARLVVLTANVGVVAPKEMKGKQQIAIAIRAMRLRLNGSSRLESDESDVSSWLTNSERILLLNKFLSPKDVCTHSALSVSRMISACPVTIAKSFFGCR
ncbi:MAG: hypothetical protein WAM85_11385 [Terracidiphilus sp.]